MSSLACGDRDASPSELSRRVGRRRRVRLRNAELWTVRAPPSRLPRSCPRSTGLFPPTSYSNTCRHSERSAWFSNSRNSVGIVGSRPRVLSELQFSARGDMKMRSRAHTTDCAGDFVPVMAQQVRPWLMKPVNGRAPKSARKQTGISQLPHQGPRPFAPQQKAPVILRCGTP